MSTAPHTHRSIAIVGSGISGLVSAYLLHPDHDIVLYEAEDYIGGHTHTVLKEPVIVKKGNGATEKVYIFQAGKYYEYLGRIDLDFSREENGDWTLIKIRSQLIPMDESVSADPKISEHLEEYQRQNQPAPAVGVGVSP